jgi:decaprenyl-phosphate phosphoribosyltransferase
MSSPVLLRAVRPRQWVKNALVLAAPLAAGRVDEPDVLVGSALAFIVFCLAAGAVYLINDVRDVEEDRRHPTKRLRAIASGELPETTAYAVAGVLLVAALTAGLLVAVPLGVTVAVYLTIQLAYAGGLKHQPVMDLACVASGFLLRAIGGGVATGIPLSPWFLLVASFGSLFMVAGKRYSEIHTVGAAAGTRRSLEYYSESYLRFIWSMAASVTVVAYSLWAFERVELRDDFPWAEISVAPFVLALMRYAVDIDRGTAGTPEDIAFTDRVLQLLALSWVATVTLAVYA